MRPMIIAGNWKMNLNRRKGEELARAVAERFPQSANGVEIVVAPAFPYLIPVADTIRNSAVQLAAQNAWKTSPGAYTGEVAVEMLKDVGCKYIILGHSERRHVLKESDELINDKVLYCVGQGVKVILCVGELLEERTADKTEDVLNQQMKLGLKDLSSADMANVVIAYEPVWAIGTGHTATKEQAEEVHSYLRRWLTNRFDDQVAEQTVIQYGGSVKPTNAAELLAQPNVDGALIGGASLTPDQFIPIIESAIELQK